MGLPLKLIEKNTLMSENADRHEGLFDGVTVRKYQICTKCIMDTTAEEIIFDENGVCSFCHAYEREVTRYPKSEEEKAKELDRRIALIKSDGEGKQYDCVIGLSGGVDSSYLSWLVKSKGLRPLAVHVDTGWNAEIAVGNIENIVKTLGIDLYTVVVDWNEMQDLQRAFLLARLPNCDIPQDHTFMAAIMKTAQKKRIRHVISGHNIATEYILPESWGYPSEDLSHLMDVHSKFGKLKLNKFPRYSLFQRIFVSRYIFKISIHRLLYFVDYRKADARKIIEEKLKWRDYGGKHCESRFTSFFQSYYLPEKFGFDKRRAHLSNLIASAQTTRDEALIEMQKLSYDAAKIETDTEFFCKKLDISSDTFHEIMKGRPGSHADYKSDKTIWWYRLARKIKRNK